MIKKSPRILLFIIFIILIITPVLLNQYYNFLLSPVMSKTPDDQSQIFVIKPGQALIQIAQNLQANKLIKSALAFRLLVTQMGISKNIQAGDFRLNGAMSSRDIAQELTHGAIDIWVTLPEGLRVEEQAQIIESKLKFGQNTNFQFDKKAYINQAEEGYMFPDTYLIPKDATSDFIAKKLRQTFSEKVSEDILKKGIENDLSKEDVVILASLIEREAKTNEEKPIIAGILLNRLNSGLALQVDATLSYAKGYDSAKNNWWSAPTVEDYRQVRSLYNTYLHVGLPPGPIASPGLESIRSSIEPADTPYFYYLHDLEGKIHYAKTVDEHNRNIQEYLY